MFCLFEVTFLFKFIHLPPKYVLLPKFACANYPAKFSDVNLLTLIWVKETVKATTLAFCSIQ